MDTKKQNPNRFDDVLAQLENAKFILEKAAATMATLDVELSRLITEQSNGIEAVWHKIAQEAIKTITKGD